MNAAKIPLIDCDRVAGPGASLRHAVCGELGPPVAIGQRGI